MLVGAPKSTDKLNPQELVKVGSQLLFYFQRDADYDLALSCLRQALVLDASCYEAWLVLGVCYAKGKGVFMDVEQAFKCFSNAVSVNPSSVLAWYNMGLCYQLGIGITPDTTRAFEIFNKAVNMGGPSSAPVLYHIGICLEKGINISVNTKQAFNNYLEAVSRDPHFLEGWERLVMCYENGIGTESNLVQAEECEKRARGIREKEPSKLVYCSVMPFRLVSYPSDSAGLSLASAFSFRNNSQVERQCPTLPPSNVHARSMSFPPPIIYSNKKSAPLSSSSSPLLVRVLNNQHKQTPSAAKKSS